MAIKLGSTVKDTITGFEGIAVERVQWKSGCDHISVQAPGLKDGVPLPELAFEEPRLESTDAVAELAPHPLLRKKVSEKTSGFTGEVVAVVYYLHSSLGLLVRSEKLDEGKPVQRTFHECDLLVVSASKEESPRRRQADRSVLSPAPVTEQRRGGPRPVPSRQL